jgi:hypothetical protein
MSKTLDLEAIQKMMDENPDDWYTGEEAEARFDAGLKAALGVTGPRVTAKPVRGYAGVDYFAVDIDFGVIEKRGRDLQSYI